LIKENDFLINWETFDNLEDMGITVVICFMITDIARYLGLIDKDDNRYRVLLYN